MAKDYVERRYDSFYLIDSRIPLALVVWLFQNGAAPEAIRLSYSTLSLEQVYGAITFYLGNKEVVEQDMADRRREEDEFIRTHPNPPGLKEKLQRRRQEMLSQRT